MNNEYYGAPTTPTSDYLAHYGIKGMKWGVRKAVASGSSRRLARQYAKASKKLAKLEKRAASGKKYAKRAALMGAGAAGMGAVAATGTAGISNAIGAAGTAFSQGAKGAGGLMQRVGGAMQRRGIRGGGRMTAAGKAVSGLGKHNASGVAGRVANWGKQSHDVATASRNISGEVARRMGNAGIKGQSTVRTIGNRTADTLEKYGHGRISNSGLVRLGAAAAGAGLAGGAAYNAYRAATTKRAGRKAAEFRKEMNKAFAGTQYANGGAQKRKRRRG